MIGTSLGPYKIIEQIGAGGMGEVYLGEDTRLGRKVAIKVLPAEFASDPERLARFEQEARAAAALNHPHIAVVHDIGTEPGEDGTTTHFMVQEYLEGQSLRDRLDKGALPLDKALDLATEVGEALIAAHKAGIIHRDLKPDNIFVTEGGHAKVLDFGLAKLTEGAAPGTEISMSPTVLGTVAGQVMGTAGYMAPEQVQGDGEIDQRADLFAFGCVLYEMVGGKRAFGGETVLDTLHAITRSEPQPLGEIKPDVPAEVHRILRKCLAKDPARRYQVADDVAVDLCQLQDDIAAGLTAPAAIAESAVAIEEVAQSAGLSWKLVAPIAIVLMALSALGAWYVARPLPEDPQVTRFEFPLPAGNLTTGTGRRAVAISPEGDRIVFVADGFLWLRDLDDFEATQIRGTEGVRSPFFSPDGQEIGFWAGGELKRVQITGGAPIPIAVASNPHGASWADDGRVFFGQGGDGIFAVPATGGEPTVVVSVQEGERAHGPQLLPGSEWLLFTLRSSATNSWDDATIVAQSLADPDDRRELVHGGRDGRYVATGHIVYAREGSLLAVAFDPGTLEAIGGSVSLFDGVSDGGASTGAAHFSISERGGLVYRPGVTGRNRTIVWVDEDGDEEALGPDPADFWWLGISPDGTKVVVTVYDEAGSRDIWLWDTESETFGRATSGEMDFGPLWSDDGATIAFARGTSAAADADRNVYVAPPDGSDDAVPLYEDTETLYPLDWAPDGRLIALYRRGRGTADVNDDIVALDIDGQQFEEIVATDFDEQYASLSPDGEWLAYTSDDSGQPQVFVRRFPDPGRRWSVSLPGGNLPRWSPDGDAIYYTQDGSMWRAMLRLDTEATVIDRQLLFGVAGYRIGGSGTHAYDVHPQTGRFLIVKNDIVADDPAAEEPHLSVVLNWFEELKERVPTGR